jgi:hypothetical protein
LHVSEAAAGAAAARARLHVGGVVRREDAAGLPLQRIAQRGRLAAAERLARRQHRLRPLQHLRARAHEVKKSSTHFCRMPMSM